MNNIQQIESGFQKSESVERINDLTAAIKAAPDNAVNLLSTAITTETDSAVKTWLIRFREAFKPLNMEATTNV